MRRQRPFILGSLFAVVFFSLVYREFGAVAATNFSPSGSAGLSQRYVPGEMIVKFRDATILNRQQVIQQSQNSLAKGQPGVFASVALQTNSANVNGLNSFYGLQSISVAFEQLPDVNAIQKQYPERTARAFSGAGIPDFSNIYVFKFPDNADIELIAKEYEKSDPSIEYAHANYYLEWFSLPNDTYVDLDQNGQMSVGLWGQGYEDLWGWKKIHADEIWQTETGKDIIVAVVDSGVDYNHKDFFRDDNGNGKLDPEEQYNFWINPCEDLNHNGFVDNGDFNGKDDPCPGEIKGNDFVDDIRGWDFGEHFGPDPIDIYGHGTHVAGTIAAIGNNAEGIIGVAPEAKIMPVRVDAYPLSLFGLTAATGLIYAAANGADVINNSWGCPQSECDLKVIEDAVKMAYGLGSVVVFAAGNSNADARLSGAQRMTEPKPIVVAASDQNDRPTDFTSFGTVVDVAAPGGGPGRDNTTNNILSLAIRNGYKLLAGTSMSAPHVSGVAALIIASHENNGIEQCKLGNQERCLSNEGVRQILRATADDILNPGIDYKTGAGRINAAKAVSAANIFPPEGRITYPIDDDLINQKKGLITISGTAGSGDFAYYTLEYGPGITPADSEWKTDGIVLADAGKIQKKGEPLGTWNVRNLPDGFYSIRLNVHIKNSNFVFRDKVFVVVNPFTRIASDYLIDEKSPDIAGHRVVWRATKDRQNIFSCVYDGNGVCPEERLSGNQFLEDHPAIAGDWVTWDSDISRVAARNLSGEDYLTLPVDGNSRGLNPDISEKEYIVFSGFINNSSAVYLYDLIERKQYKVADIYISNFAVTSPAISGDLIVWHDSSAGFGSNSDVYACTWDPTSKVCGPKHPITNEPSRQEFPVVSGNRIAWEDWRRGVPNIYYCEYDPQTGICVNKPITNSSVFSAKVPAISGDWIVWEDYRDNAEAAEIYAYNLETQKEHRVTYNQEVSFEPSVDGNLLVWTQVQNGQNDVLMFDLSEFVTTVTVWPGDTNNNGKVNQADVLPLGLYWQKVGPKRPNASTLWQGQSVAAWSPEAATYADANGDGVVNQADILPIGLNWGKRHP